MQKKVTLSLDAELMQQIRQIVKGGQAKSQSEFFEDALKAKLKEIKQEKRRQALLEASVDPLFLADIEEIEREFTHADAEAARMIE